MKCDPHVQELQRADRRRGPRNRQTEVHRIAGSGAPGGAALDRPVEQRHPLGSSGSGPNDSAPAGTGFAPSHDSESVHRAACRGSAHSIAWCAIAGGSDRRRANRRSPRRPACEKKEKEVRHRNVSERGDAAVQRVAPQPTDHADVTADHSEERAEKAERAGRHRRQSAPRVTGRTRRGQRAEVTRRLAPDEPDRHPEHAQGDDDPEDRRPADDGRRARLVVLRLDRELRWSTPRALRC